MKKIKQLLKDNKFVLLSFIISLILFIILFLYLKLEPFGNRSILVYDLEQQYVDFFSFLKQNTDGLFTFSRTLGGEVVGLYSYYLLSPFNIILFFTPLKFLTSTISLIMILKLSLACLTFSYFLKSKYNKNDISILMWGLLYSFSSFGISYMCNIMWLDALYLMPLVVLGIDKYFKNESLLLYSLSYLILLISNYYMAFICSIFIFLYYIFNVDYKKQFLRKLLKFGINTLLIIGTASIILIPTLFSLKNGKMDSLNIISFELIISLKELVSSFSIMNPPYQLNELNIYCGILPIICLIYYFMDKKVDKKEKIKNIVFIIIFVLSFSFRIFDSIWHAFNIPQWFIYRYSFLFIFLILLISFKGFINILSEDKNIILITIISIIFYFIATLNMDITIKLITVILIVIYILFIKFKKKYLLLIVIIIELLLNTNALLRNEFYNNNDSNYYYNYISDNKKIINNIHDNSLYRLEKNYKRYFNDSMSIDYNGIDHFSSLYYKPLLDMFNNLGLLQYFYKVDYLGNTPITNSLFGIKYIISNKELDDYSLYRKVNDKYIYLNSNALSTMFISNNKITNLGLTDNVFINQNIIVNSILDNNTEYFKKSNYDIKTINCSLTKNGNELIFTNNGNTSEIILKFDSKDKYIYITGSELYNDVKIILGDNEYSYFNFENDAYIINLSEHNTNEIKISFNNDTLKINKLLVYELDLDTLKNDLSYVDNLEVLKNKTNLSVNTNYTDDKLVMTTIPYDKGWRLYIDGEEKEISKALDSLIAFEIPEGEHNIVLKFIPRGTKIGTIGSIISIIFLVLFNLFTNKNKNDKI